MNASSLTASLTNTLLFVCHTILDTLSDELLPAWIRTVACRHFVEVYVSIVLMNRKKSTMVLALTQSKSPLWRKKPVAFKLKLLHKAKAIYPGLDRCKQAGNFSNPVSFK
jgi:hypothetical protein